MQKKHLIAVLLLFCFQIISCNKKQPQTVVTASTNNAIKSRGNKKSVKKIIKTPVPKVIIVNDKTASRTIDGRLYYDLEGNRYWRNYRDKKYYLYNKTMYADSAFKPH